MLEKKQKKNKLFSLKYFVYDFSKWFMGWPGLIWYRMKKIYVSKEAKKHNKGSFIIASNHVGMDDAFIVHIAFIYRRLHFAIAKEFTEKKFPRWLFNHFLCFSVDRNNSSFGALNPMLNELKKDGAIVMFPEGHISTDSEVHEFKTGMTLLTYRSKAPLQMMYFEKRKHWWNSYKVVISDTFNVYEMVGKIPTPEKIKEVSAFLYEKEMELRKIYREHK